jgi:hypothetical protein
MEDSFWLNDIGGIERIISIDSILIFTSIIDIYSDDFKDFLDSVLFNLESWIS